MRKFLSSRSYVYSLALCTGLGFATCVQASSAFDLNDEDNLYRAAFNHPIHMTVELLTESSYLDICLQYKTPYTLSKDLTLIEPNQLLHPAYMINEDRYWESVVTFIDQKSREVERVAVVPTISSVLDNKSTSESVAVISKSGLTYPFYSSQDYWVNDQIMSIQVSNTPFLSIPSFNARYIQLSSSLHLNIFATQPEFAKYLSNAFHGKLHKNMRLQEKETISRLYS